jgi:hypothetical protein
LLTLIGVEGALQFFAACPADERAAALAWAGLFALEGICRSTVLRRLARLRHYERAWSLVNEVRRFTL